MSTTNSQQHQSTSTPLAPEVLRGQQQSHQHTFSAPASAWPIPMGLGYQFPNTLNYAAMLQYLLLAQTPNQLTSLISPAMSDATINSSAPAKTQAAPMNEHRHHYAADPAKVHRCPLKGCGRSFTDHSNAKRHKLTHLNFCPFKCTHCSRSFSRRASALAHLVRVHDETCDSRVYQEMAKQPVVVPTNREIDAQLRIRHEQQTALL